MTQKPLCCQKLGPAREFKGHAGYRVLWSAVGRTKVLLTCPFCDADVEAYLWSLAGSGKKCGCGAVLGQTGAWRTVKEVPS